MNVRRLAQTPLIHHQRTRAAGLLGPEQVLSRGYSITMDAADGKSFAGGKKT